MKIDAISDLHGYMPQLEGGDLLIVAGDLTANDSEIAYLRFFEWLTLQKYKKIIFISGNHDNYLQEYKPKYKGHIEYLCDSRTEFEGLKIWGTPHSLWFNGINPHCTAFTGNEKDLANKFALIPDDTDILICHGPPFGIKDKTVRGENVGSHALLEAIKRVIPQIVIFAHIHEDHGYMKYKFEETVFGIDHEIEIDCYNVSHVNENYKPVNKATRIEL